MDTAQQPAAAPAELCTVQFVERELEDLIDILRTFQLHRRTILATFAPAPERFAYAISDDEQAAWFRRADLIDLAETAGELMARLVSLKQDAFPDGRDDL